MIGAVQHAGTSLQPPTTRGPRGRNRAGLGIGRRSCFARWALRTSAIAGVLALMPVTGCEQRSPSPGPHAAATNVPTRPPSAVYVVRGRIVQLPDPARPQSEFQVHHEAIDDFKNGDGVVVGMGAMVMPFALGPGVTLEGFGEGDLIELTFPVWWDDSIPTYHASKIVKLPAGTLLEFRAARPNQDDPKPAGAKGAEGTSGTPAAPGAVPPKGR